MAKLVGTGGKVISADLQEGMLQELSRKIKGTELEHRIKPIRCDQDRINISERVDLILAFYMVHEVPDKSSFFKQLKDVLNERGQILLVEPKLFHVSRKAFELTIKVAEDNGFRAYQGPKLLFSWSAVLRIA
jgi:ubiquinone/menaquinone biosynthesis C-methylase UbiE